MLRPLSPSFPPSPSLFLLLPPFPGLPHHLPASLPLPASFPRPLPWAVSPFALSLPASLPRPRSLLPPSRSFALLSSACLPSYLGLPSTLALWPSLVPAALFLIHHSRQSSYRCFSLPRPPPLLSLCSPSVSLSLSPSLCPARSARPYPYAAAGSLAIFGLHHPPLLAYPAWYRAAAYPSGCIHKHEVGPWLFPSPPTSSIVVYTCTSYNNNNI